MLVMGSGVEMKVERRMPTGEEVMVTLMVSSMSVDCGLVSGGDGGDGEWCC